MLMPMAITVEGCDTHGAVVVIHAQGPGKARVHASCGLLDDDPYLCLHEQPHEKADPLLKYQHKVSLTREILQYGLFCRIPICQINPRNYPALTVIVFFQRHGCTQSHADDGPHNLGLLYGALPARQWTSGIRWRTPYSFRPSSQSLLHY